MEVQFSVIVPLKNEEGNIVELIHEIDRAMNQINAPWELLCVDDGSTDQTLPLLKKMSHERPHLRILAFDRNYGQSSAFDAGFKHAAGAYVITLDGDRQNDPADIPKLISAIKDVDMVCGYRQKRNDPIMKRVISTLANKVRSRLCGDGVRDTGCSLKIYRKQCLEQIKMYHGMHRFLPALFKIEGFKVMEIPVNHRERPAGKTKYNLFNRSFNTVADLFAVRWMRKRQLRYKIQAPLKNPNRKNDHGR